MGAARSKAASSGITVAAGSPPITAAATILMAPNAEFDSKKAIQTSSFGFRVCLVKRSANMRFMPGAWVFPGGRVDKEDFTIAEDPDECPDVFSHGGLRVAAVRELHEEIGVVINRQGLCSSADFARYHPAAAGLLVPFQRWCTPRQEKRRFDTWFFMFQTRADFPSTIQLRPAREELDEAIWISPEDALKRHQTEEGFKMPPPIYLMMAKLATYTTVGPAIHEQMIHNGNAMNEMRPLLPERRISPEDGAFELHFRPNTLHIHEGVHIFPGNFTPKDRLPEGMPTPTEWRVFHGSPIFDPLTEQLIHDPEQDTPIPGTRASGGADGPNVEYCSEEPVSFRPGEAVEAEDTAAKKP